MSGISLLVDTNAVPFNKFGGCGTQKQFLVLPFIMFCNVDVCLWPSALFLQFVTD